MNLKQYAIMVISFFVFSINSQELLKETRLDSISVFFESGSSVVIKRQNILSRINQLENQVAGKVVLVGYTDSVGSVVSNQLLASKRLQSVKEMIKGSRAKGYLIDTLNLNERSAIQRTDDNQFRRVDILVYKIEPTYSIGKPVTLNIQFQTASDYVLTSSLEAMKELVFVMKLDPSLEIKLNGHVCCAPDQPLSLNRAKRVKSFLTKNGIEDKRITCFGYSNSVKLVDEISPETQAINRRVEVVFFKN